MSVTIVCNGVSNHSSWYRSHECKEAEDIRHDEGEEPDKEEEDCEAAALRRKAAHPVRDGSEYEGFERRYWQVGQ